MEHQRKISCAIIFIILFLFPLISAGRIEVKTIPNHEVQITLISEKDGKPIVLERLESVSDKDGGIIFDTNVESNFNLLVFVKNNGESVFSQKYLKNYNPDENIFIELLLLKELDSEDLKPNTSSNYLFYILLGVVIIIIFISFKKIKRKNKPKEIRIVKLSQLIADGKFRGKLNA